MKEQLVVLIERLKSNKLKSEILLDEFYRGELSVLISKEKGKIETLSFCIEEIQKIINDNI